MAEFNPYKLEEEKWTPNNVYEILPPNAVSWSNYDFGQGTDNVDQEAANKSLLDGFADFFKELFGTAGQILSGAVELGGEVLGGFVEGVVNFIGGIANAIGSIFGDGSSESPNLPLFNPIKTNLEAAIQPHLDKINESWQRTEAILAEQEVLRGQMDDSLEEMRNASSRAQEASDRAGAAITEAQAASAAATEARQTLEAYNTELNQRITTEFNSAVGRADTAVAKADTLAEELEDFKAQHQLEIADAVAKAEQAVADLATLTPKVDDAVSKANKATSDVSTLTPKVTKATEDAKAAQDKVAELTQQVASAASEASTATANVNTLTTKVNDAVTKANKASTDVATLTPQVADAISKANKATSDVSTITPKVTAAQEKADSAYTKAENVRNEVTPKIEAAQTKSETALAAADKAISDSEFIAGFADDLIPKDAVGKSTWGSNLEPGDISPEDSAFGSERTYIMSSTTIAPEPFIPVKGQDVYRLTLWVKRHPEGTSGWFSFDLRSATGSADWTHFRVNFGSWRTKEQSSYLLEIISASRWDKFTIDFRWPESAGPAYVNLDQSAGGKFYVHDVQVRVITPVDNSVDLAQNDALKAIDETIKQQWDINEAQRVANLAQQNFNDNQEKWNLASENAIQALADAQQVQANLNIEQGKLNDLQADFNAKQIEWNNGVTAALETQKKVNDNFTKWNTAVTQAQAAQNTLNTNQQKWNDGVTAALDAQKKVNDNFTKWTEGATTAIEANTKAIKALNAPESGASLMPVNPLTNEPYYMQWAGDRLNLSTVEEVPATVGVTGTFSAKGRRDAPSDGFVLSKLNKGQVYRWSVWTYSSVANSDVRFLFKDPVRGLVTKKCWGDEGVTVAASQWGIILTKVPQGWSKQSGTIEFDDKADYIYLYAVEYNFTALSNITQSFAGLDIYPDVPKQADVDEAQNRAIAANTEALKALGKKALGASLVPYKTPSTQEVLDYAAGKLNYDPWADPEYFNAGHSIAENTTYGRYARAYSSQGTKTLNGGTYVSVDSSIEYRIKFDAYAQDAGSRFYVGMLDQNGSTAVQATSIRDSGVMATGPYPIDNLTLKQGWNSYSGLIRFKPTTTSARLERFYWNHPNGVSTTQGLTNLEIVPNIPDANVVNMLQDQAILENTKVGSANKAAIDALRDGLNAAVELGEVNKLLEDFRVRLSNEEEKRLELQRKIDDLQNEMIPRTIVIDDRVTYDDYVEMTEIKVTAKGNWVGQIAITFFLPDDDRRGFRTGVTRKSVYSGQSRTWDFPDGVQRVDYWVYKGVPRTVVLQNVGRYITGSTFSNGTWVAIASKTVGKTYGTGKMSGVGYLKNADRGVTYGVKIQVNGTDVKTFTWSGIGPLTPLGSGERELRFEHEFNLPDNATVRILGYANNSNASKAEVALLGGVLTYVEDTSR